MSVPVPTVDLRPDHWNIVRGALRRHVPDRGVLAFGSRATWTAKDYSDLDLAVIGEEPLSLRTASALDKALGDSDLPFKVDIVDWARIDDSFRAIIRRDGVAVQIPAARSDSARAASPSSPVLGTSAALSDWRESTWGEEINLEYGKARRGHNNSTGLFRVFGSNGPIGWTDTPLVSGPGVVLGRKGVYRGVEYSPDPFFVIDTAYYVASKSTHDMRWLYYAIKHYQLGEIDDGSPIPSTTRAAVYPCKLTVPPLPEQRAIAHILGALDDKIELNRRMNETLEAMARALFKSWFVDFDPVRAKMEGRDTGLPQDIASLFPDRLVDSEMGVIPEGWEVSEIGKEVNAVGGSTPSTKESSYWHQGEHHWATPKDLSNLWSPVLLGTSRKITSAGLKRIGSGALPIGTVLLSSRAPIGYLAVTEVPTAVNQGFIAMKCEQRLPNLYVLFWCYENLDYIRDIAGGTTFAEISKKAFRPVPVIVPSEAILAMHIRLSRPLYHRLVVNMKETVTLAALRDTLLPKLISGEIRVGDAERAVEFVT